jgi:hypothetical protein
MFAEWRKLSPGLAFEGTEREARLEYARAHIQRFARSGAAPASWSDLTEREAQHLLKSMREESGDGPAYRARLIARLGQELFGAPWDRLLADRVAARFRVHRLEDLTPRQAHEFIEELLSRIARRDAISIEDARSRLTEAK